MKCPVCHDVRMKEVQKDGVLIDVCPECKGVWLDRGELDKLLGGIREIRPAFNEWSESRGHYDHDDEDDNDYKRRSTNPSYKEGKGYDSHHGQGHYKPKKKKSVLDVFGDLFD
ncbi:zf-TFIIB domain-containing protein [Paenibacillus physcomitrellae]|uniref:Transcription factor zinc-finger domain-containing protein n=1 Tax=Paenibacillus physcomitrellae TaxID=1619311 RepID=A0ABQ1GXL0_9BACL|nr:zf-TFIIB domain-containing protein [Paenibacillus physcomitrellae]GGA51792.1 hypothetical protein GCM10010917_41300 [Paenibacillus physcomitrellae]